MSTTNPPSDLHLAMQTWHAALARNDLNAQIAARRDLPRRSAAQQHHHPS